jgi:ATPase family AAA domain-containing protein 2
MEAAAFAPAHQVETVTTTVEVHRGPDGDVVEVVNGAHSEQVIDADQPMPPAVDVEAEGVNESVALQQVQAQPQLYDVDLERMHVDLYRDKYLTPDDFVVDIRKIVHNANVRVNEDPERLFRAQAMLITAEVSILDFDANFQLECQRIAAREQQRREQYKQNQAKEKEASPQNGATNQLPPRWSARANGLQPELSITNPLKLERRLKRAWSSEANTEPSEEEAGDEGHTAKCSRVSSAELDSQHHAVTSYTSAGSPGRPHAVWFIDDPTQIEHPPFPTPHTNDPLPELPIQTQDGQPPQRNGEFDRSLLNPMSPTTKQKLYNLTPSTSTSELPTVGPSQSSINGFVMPQSQPMVQDKPLMLVSPVPNTGEISHTPPVVVPEPMQIE